jgi:hypothetical protein
VPSADGPGSGAGGVSPGGSSTPALQPADPAAIAAARTVIEAARLEDPATIGAVGAIRYDDGAVEAAAEVLAGGAQGDARWAATWVYATSGADPTPLHPLLTDPDPSIRVMAAAALVALGDAAGIPVLVALTTEAAQLRGSLPPVSVSAYAAGSLARFVTGPAVDPGAAPDAVHGTWQAWMDQHAAGLRFDPVTGLWSAS